MAEMLTDLNPEEVAPNFLAYLKQRGNVEVGSTISPIQRQGVSIREDRHTGVKKDIFIDGKVIGYIERHIEPPYTYFEGEIPNVLSPNARHEKSKARKNRYVVLVYTEKHPLAKKTRRGDGWTTIPFP